MTYTYKLARRLAIARELAMLASLLLLVACVKDLTSPDAGSTGSLSNPTSLQVIPRSVTIETRQQVQFRGQALTLRGATIPTPVAWVASGGTINADGTFSSSTAGTFKVIGRGRGWKQADTSVVNVVTAPSDLVRIAVTPGSASLDPGTQRTFTATGYLSDGSTATIGVVWSATGGDVDPSGVYTAGPAAGSYRVIATNTAGALADTASVTINQPAPTLASVVLSPASVSLSTGVSKQFKAYGRNSLGDSVSVPVTFSATGGTISPAGLYTAGSTAGTYRVIARTSELADTAVVTLVAATQTTGRIGVPFGPTQQLSRVGSINSPFTMSMDGTSPSTIVSRIQAARSGGYTLLLALPGGSHDEFMSVIDGVYQFDGKKWRAAVDAYNTSTIRQAVAAAVADGVVLGDRVMDEPYVSGAGDGNTWGPKGTMTKARVDSLCGYVKDIFPTLPAGPAAQHQLFEPDKSYRVCDFYLDQYKAAYGSVTAFRDAGLKMAARDGHNVMFSLSILDGGVQDKDGTWDCTGTGQAGKGTYSPNCRMTAEQVRDWGILLGSAGCAGLDMWRYDSEFVSDPANQQAFRDLMAKLSTLPVRSCLRN